MAQAAPTTPVPVGGYPTSQRLTPLAPVPSPQVPPALDPTAVQATTAPNPPKTLRTSPQFSFPYGAAAGDARPYG